MCLLFSLVILLQWGFFEISAQFRNTEQTGITENENVVKKPSFRYS